MSQVIVCQGPQMEERSRESLGERWCFAHRHRAEFFQVVMMPVIDWDDEATIYAAMWGGYAYTECSRCGSRESDLFPGWRRSYDYDL